MLNHAPQRSFRGLTTQQVKRAEHHFVHDLQNETCTRPIFGSRYGALCVAFAEADAQVAFLVQCGLASAVITEDSDILVYMAAIKCTAPVLYKLDEFGKCKELGFDPAKLSSLPGEQRRTSSPPVSL